MMQETRHFATIREASFDDYRQVAALADRYGVNFESYDEWKHLWLGNPVYLELGGKWPIGWVLENSRKQIVGYCGNIPLGYTFGRQRLVGASARAWVVDLAYRGFSIVLLDLVLSQKKADLCVNTSVGERAGAEAFRALGGLPIPAVSRDESAFWITHEQRFAESYLAMKRVPCPKTVSYPLSLPLKLRRSLIMKASSNGFQIDSCASFDERFTEFWETFKAENPHLLLSDRTRKALQWHFDRALRRNSAWIFTLSAGPRLVAYAIFCRQDNVNFRLKRVRLVDFRALGANCLSFTPLLDRALKRCRQEGVHMLEIGGWFLDKAAFIQELAPYTRKVGEWFYLYKVNNQSIAQSLRDPKVWDPSFFDGDTTL